MWDAGESGRIAQYIDHTFLKPDGTFADIERLCSEAVSYGFHSVCVHPSNVSLAAKAVSGSPVVVCTVIGFPLGATTTEAKVFEAGEAIHHGARELDMVMNLGALKSGDTGQVERDIRAVVERARPHLVKVIIETCYLTDDEKRVACEIAEAAGAGFVKTSTGFGSAGATVGDVRLMRAAVSARVGVKASGGIRDLTTALAMIRAGASRLGTSASVRILEEACASKSPD